MSTGYKPTKKKGERNPKEKKERKDDPAKELQKTIKLLLITLLLNLWFHVSIYNNDSAVFETLKPFSKSTSFAKVA